MGAATAPTSRAGWQGLFWHAFRQSKNPMILLDERRLIVDINGPMLKVLGYDRSSLLGTPMYALRVPGTAPSDREWRAAIREQHFTGVGDFQRAGGLPVRVEFAGHPEVVTGRQLVLFVALHTGRSRPPGVRAHRSSSEPETLSPREVEVVTLVALGLSGPEIADELQVAHNTVRTHIRNAMLKSGARSRAQLVAMAIAGAHYLQPLARHQ